MRGHRHSVPKIRNSGRAVLAGALCGGKVLFALPQALEELVAFAATADANVLVLEHRLDDPQDWLGTQVVGAVKAVHGLEDVVLAQARVFEGAVLEAVVLDQVRLVPLRKPAVLTGHLVKFGAGIWRREADLHAEDVELLREANRLLDGLLRLDRQAEDEGAVNYDARLVAGFGEAAHLVQRDALLDVLENLLVAALVADQEQAQAGVFERLDGVVVKVGAAVPGRLRERQ